MLMPRKVKHRKHQRGKMRGRTKGAYSLDFGSFGLKAEENGWVSAREIEAARRAITRFIQKGGKIWIRVFPDKPVTQKGAETPMGSGKGAVDHFVSVVKRGRIIFEMDGVSESVAKEALRLASYKFSIKTKFIKKL